MKSYEFTARTTEEAISAGLEELGVSISDVTVEDLNIADHSYISATIEVPGDAEHVGGINLFGNWFGDYPQALILRLGYKMRAETVFDP